MDLSFKRFVCPFDTGMAGWGRYGRGASQLEMGWKSVSLYIYQHYHITEIMRSASLQKAL